MPGGAAPYVELDEATIAELQAAHGVGPGDGALARREVPRPHRGASTSRGPALRSGASRSIPTRWPSPTRSTRSARRRAARAAARHPVLIKDNIDTADRMTTTAGSLALAGCDPRRATPSSSTRLRAAGAVILGKTNLSEWANFRSTHSTSGWSGRGGQSQNPYALDRNPSGSSSGLRARRSPPTSRRGRRHRDRRLDRVARRAANGARRHQADRRPRQPHRHHPDLPQPGHGRADGPHGAPTRRVLLGAMAGVDRARRGDRAPARGKAPRDYTKFLDAGRAEGRADRRGAQAALRLQRRGRPARREAIAAMKEQGAVIVDPADIPTLGKLDEREFEVLLYEFKADLNAYLAGLGPAAPVHSLTELIAFNERAQGPRRCRTSARSSSCRRRRRGRSTIPDYKKALANVPPRCRARRASTPCMDEAQARRARRADRRARRG